MRQLHHAQASPSRDCEGRREVLRAPESPVWESTHGAKFRAGRMRPVCYAYLQQTSGADARVDTLPTFTSHNLSDLLGYFRPNPDSFTKLCPHVHYVEL